MGNFTPEYIESVRKELESRGWRPDSRGDAECYDEASAAGADIIAALKARLADLEKSHDLHAANGERLETRLAEAERLLRAADIELYERCGPDGSDTMDVMAAVDRERFLSDADSAPAAPRWRCPMTTDIPARLAEALFLLNRWHEAYHADGGMEMLDDDTTTCLAGITVSAACEWCKPDARCPDHGAACIEDIEGVTDSAPAAPRCERCGDSGWIQGNPVIGISDEPCGCDERDASTADEVKP